MLYFLLNNIIKKIIFIFHLKKMLNKQILIILLLNLIECDKEKLNLVESLIKWSKKRKIYINPSLKLNPVDGDHNLPYFTSNEEIKTNTTLISIPKNMLITQNLITELINNNTKSKYKGLWEKLLHLDNAYINYYSTKELFYMATMIEHFMRIKKGKFYHLFGKYFDIYQYTNLDNYPIFYSKEEIDFISQTNFYDEINRALNSIENEQKILTNDLKYFSSDLEAFLKYRVLILSNSINKNNITYVIPFYDSFKRDIFENICDAKIEYDNITQSFNIVSINNIAKNKEIVVLMKRMPNKSTLLYFGFTSENNNFIGSYPIEKLNNLLRQRLKLDLNVLPINRTYDISDGNFINNNIESYKSLKEKIDKYKNNPIGEYILMKDNLEDYLKLYDKFTDGKFNEIYYGNQKIINVKRIINMEKKLIEVRLNYLNSVINDKKKNQKQDL